VAVGDGVVHFESDFSAEQIAACEWMIAHPFSMLWADMGTGKTAITYRLLFKTREFWKRALIVGPIKVIENTWPDERMNWPFAQVFDYTILRSDETTPYMRQRIIDAKNMARARGDSTEHIARMSSRLQASLRRKLRREKTKEDTRIHFINNESLEWLLITVGKDSWPYDLVIIDEISHFYDHKSTRWKVLNLIRPLTNRMHGLTASPSPEGYHNLFAPTYLFDRGERFGSGVTKFQERYFTKKTWKSRPRLRPGAADEIAEKMSSLVFTIRRDRKPKDRPRLHTREFTLSETEQATYDRMQEESVMSLEDGSVITADNAGVVVMKTLQLASGFVFDNKGAWHQFHDHKFQILKELVEEAQGTPVMVGYWFRPTLERLKTIPGFVAMDRRGTQVGAWNADKIKILGVHPKSGGHGLNMQFGSGHTLVYVDNPWPLDPYWQLIGRLDRQPQKKIVNVYNIVAKNTTDVRTVQGLQRKRHLEDSLWAMVRQWRSRYAVAS
jgi:hypothetical protein